VHRVWPGLACLAPESVQALIDLISRSWGAPEFAVLGNPSLSIDDERTRISARTMRASATPRAAANQYEYILRGLDVRSALPLVHAPTLVLHNSGNLFCANRTQSVSGRPHPRGKVRRVPGSDLTATSSSESSFVDEVAEFLTGARSTSAINRVLTTMKFTDIVESTSQLAASGTNIGCALSTPTTPSSETSSVGSREGGSRPSATGS
jgi:hypothetical protein